MKKKNSYLVYVVIIAVAIVGFLIFRSAASSSGQYDELAQCLADNGVVMYGAWWCPHCQNNKKLFGDSWDTFAAAGGYVECSTAQRTQTELCQNEGITGYPTWRFADGSELNGERGLLELAQKAGCEAFLQ
ncbi:TPA: hypothetical protein HA239_05300 [Candidatus Woesearchaeota archaeon]|nr:hypothetical protein QT06_C0001G0280 [archaeon GW2011_AR15]MBS3103601.1 hypothetical protein [Candidatus Woesearchaeota archaeon]HIH41799.1 hypothetical protein [Candidatus Woesearchaeota archaeon]